MRHPISLLSSLLCCATLLSACGTKQAVPGAKPEETRQSLEVRAKDGDKNAQFELGAAYHDGSGGPKDMALARKWFEKAAAQGDVRAQFNLGVMEYMGEDVQQDYAKAKQWFEKAAAQKNARAQYNLGVMYYRGEGMKVDYTQAKKYFEEAAIQGFREAAFNLGVMYAKGEGMAQDIGQAYAWLSYARDLGNTSEAVTAIQNIEKALKPDQLNVVRTMAKDLKNRLANTTVQPQ